MCRPRPMTHTFSKLPGQPYKERTWERLLVAPFNGHWRLSFATVTHGSNERSLEALFCNGRLRLFQRSWRLFCSGGLRLFQRSFTPVFQWSFGLFQRLRLFCKSFEALLQRLFAALSMVIWALSMFEALLQ